MISKDFRIKADPIWNKILRHPFLDELRHGTLPKDTFKYFIAQDYIFLKDMITCLGIMVSKATDEGAKSLLSDMKKASESVEIDGLIRLGEMLGGIDFNKVDHAPTCYAYTRHLLYTASSGSFVEAISAITPCYWSYMEVGEHLRGSEDGFYDAWIKTYRSKEYKALVSNILEVMNRAGEKAKSEEIRAAMRAFLISSEYEYMFWDMAYKREKWIHGLRANQ